EESKRLAIEGLTRELTKAKLDSDPRGKTFRPRYVSRFVRFAKAYGHSTSEDYDVLELEKDNLQTAIDLAFGQKDWRSVLWLAHILAGSRRGVLVVRGFWDEALRIGTIALETARHANAEREVADWSITVANLYDSRGMPDEARSLYATSLDIAKLLGDKD